MINIIAHRGACKAAPQNTMPAFKIARDMGADGFENDVHLTADGHIVICHDYAIDKTSNGSGLILEMTLAQLLEYDFGSYFSQEYAGTKIASLDEFFEVAKGLPVINVEIKPPLNKSYDIVPAVINMAKEMGVFDDMIISSFDENVITKVKEYDSECKTGFLYDINSTAIDTIIKDPVAYAKNLAADAIHPVILLTSEELIYSAHENGLMVNPWTVNSSDAIKNLEKWGCDGLITDIPDFARTQLGKP